jgi:uncharacterized membrane protein
VHKRLPLLFRHVMYNLRGGFLVRPLTIALALGGAGAFLSWLEETVPAMGAWVPKARFPSHADPQVAQVILVGIAASIMTVVSIVFAILLMTLTLASMQFSPRIIVSFVKDRGDAVDARHIPGHLQLLHGGPSRTLQQDVEFGVLQIVDIATSTPDPAYRRTLAEQGRRILAGCAEKLGESELAGIRVRLAALELLLAASPAG